MFQRSSNKRTSGNKLSRTEIYRLLLENQLGRYWVTLNGSNLTVSNGCYSFLYNDIRVHVELAEDEHVFMISCTVYEQSPMDDADELYEDYLRLERGINPSQTDIRLEFEEGEQIMVYQNVSMDLAQEDCKKEFEDLFDRFLKEATKIHTDLHGGRQAPAPTNRTSPRNGWRRKSSKIKQILTGRAA